MQVAATTDRTARLADACRQLGERLGLDAVGVANDGAAGRRITWWTAAGTAALPPLEDILGGHAHGWVVCPGGELTVFGRTTTYTVVHATESLQAASAWISEGDIARLEGEPGRLEVRVMPALEDEPQRDEAEASPSTMPEMDRDAATLSAALEVVRDVMREPALVLDDLLERVRMAVGAAELFHLIERGGEIAVASAPDVAGERRLPREVCSELGALSADELTAPADDGTTAQLAAVLGMVSARTSAAFSSEAGRLEAVLAGWDEASPGLSPGAMAVLARTVSACRVAQESRTRSVDSLLVRDRTRWSERIHDDLTQAVTSAVLELRTLSKHIARDPQEAISSVEDATREVRRSLAEVRGVLFDLEREALPEGAPREPLARYVEDVLQRWQLTADVRLEGDHHHLPKRAVAAAAVVLREALANAAKHAPEGRVTVSVVVDGGTLTVEVADDGPGYSSKEAHAAEDAGHFGLTMMRRRVEAAGGALTVVTEHGTRVVARLPLTSEGDRR